MKIVISAALALSVSALSLSAQADSYSKRQHRFTEYANVVNVSPIYKEVSYQRPKRECWVEETQHIIRHEGQGRYLSNNNSRNNRTPNTGDVLVGGVIGGVIGNQLGRKGSSGARAGATIAGAIIGSALAGESSSNNRRHRRNEQPRISRLESRPSYDVRPVKRCENTTETHYEQRLQGYDVTYRYRGETYKTRTNRHPGNRIKLQVSVKPLG
jgi:uncharacterized protein YcfJ